MFVGAILAASLALTPAQSTRIDALVQHVMQTDHVPGLSLGIARNGRVLFARGYGMRNLATGARADARTIYRIGSITKQFTAALVEQEIERGALALNVEVRGITIAQLLSQTSGIVSYTDDGQTLDTAMNAPTRFTPGTQWEYSNSNYYLLGTTLQSITQLPYPTLLQRRILKPFGLRATSFNLPAGTDVAAGYAWTGTTLAPAPVNPNDAPALAFSASAMSSNVLDLLAWLSKLQDGAIVAQDDFEQMTSSWTLANGTLTHYGFGFFVDDWYGWQIAEHPGLVDGFSADDAISLEDGLDIVILTNADKEPVAPLTKAIFALVDKPKDAGLVAGSEQAALNEDPATTALVKSFVAQLASGNVDRSQLTPRFDATLGTDTLATYTQMVAPLGALQLTEYLEATHLADVTYVKYRLTFASRQYLLTLGFVGDKIDSMVLVPNQ